MENITLPLTVAGTPVQVLVTEKMQTSGANEPETLYTAIPLLGLPVTTKPIEQIHVGDKVATRNPDTGQTEFKRVVATKVRTTQTLLILVLGDKAAGNAVETLITTPQHPFYVTGKGFSAAISLAVGNAIVTRVGSPLIVQSITPQAHPEGVLVYNFEVEDDHAYFVGTTNGGTWVHNYDWEAIAKLRFENFNKLGAEEQKIARRITEVFRERYVAGTGTPIHQIRNVRNLDNGLYEIKSGQGVRVYLDRLGNVIGYSNKGNQDATIKRLHTLLK